MKQVRKLNWEAEPELVLSIKKNHFKNFYSINQLVTFVFQGVAERSSANQKYTIDQLTAVSDFQSQISLL